MNVPKSIFRQYDVRGIVDTELTPELARALGRAYASLCSSDFSSLCCKAAFVASETFRLTFFARTLRSYALCVCT